jgi:hypothetical protein
MSALDELKRARLTSVLIVAAFLVGLVVASLVKCHLPPPGDRQPLRPLPAVTDGPAPSATPPAATATAAVKTRVVIERPVPRPVSCVTSIPQNVTQEASSGAHLPDPAIAPGASGILAQPLEVERIIIETEGISTAVAPVPTPPPPVYVTTDARPGAFGVLVGTMPGVVALDYQFARGELLGHTIGASTIVNGRMLGVGGGISLVEIHDRLYLGAGAYQEYKLIPDPGLYIGAGWRF